MAQPTETQRHVNRPLTNISIAHVQSANQFFADKVFPVVPVDKRSDKYFIYTASYWARTDVAKRASATEAPVTGYELATSQFYCDVYSVAHDIDDIDRANTDAPLQPDEDGVAFVTQQHLIKRDRDFASTFFTTSVWTGSSSGSDITPSTTWDSTAATPIEDVDQQVEALLEKTNGVVNGQDCIFLLGYKVYRDLKNHPDILDRIKYNAGPGNPAVANENTLAQVFGVSRVIVARSVYNSAAEAATASNALIAAKRDALLVYANPNPGLRQPSGGYIFTWNGLLGAGAGAPQISRKRMELKGPNGSVRIEGNMAYDMKAISSVCGVFFDNCVAA